MRYTILTCHLLFDTYTRIVLTDHMLHYARIIEHFAGFLGILHTKYESIKRLHQWTRFLVANLCAARFST